MAVRIFRLVSRCRHRRNEQQMRRKQYDNVERRHVSRKGAIYATRFDVVMSLQWRVFMRTRRGARNYTILRPIYGSHN